MMSIKIAPTKPAPITVTIEINDEGSEKVEADNKQ